MGIMEGEWEGKTIDRRVMALCLSSITKDSNIMTLVNVGREGRCSDDSIGGGDDGGAMNDRR